MLLHTKNIIGHKLAATDGEIGVVHDFYFDGDTWIVRHVVAWTGDWLKERKLLLPPQALSHFDETGRVLPVDLTRQELEHHPSINHHRPVSRQVEANYYRSQGWPAIWQGERLWGKTEPPFHLAASLAAGASQSEEAPVEDANLHSTETVTGYRIAALDGVIGHVTGFILDVHAWAVCDVVIETGHWYAGKEIQLPTNQVERICYQESMVYVKLTKDQLRHAGKDEAASVVA